MVMRGEAACWSFRPARATSTASASLCWGGQAAFITRQSTLKGSVPFTPNFYERQTLRGYLGTVAQAFGIDFFQSDVRFHLPKAAQADDALTAGP
jgi:hypothetical protein